MNNMVEGSEKFYGGGEPIYEGQDIILGRLIDRIENEKKSGVPYLVGIDGPPGSGKTTFGEAMVKQLRERGEKAVLIKADDFLFPSEIRKGSGDPGFIHYSSTIDMRRLESEVLSPLRSRGELHADIMAHNLFSNALDIKRRIDIDGDTIVVIEGIYLFKELLSGYFNLRAFLHVEDDLVRARIMERNKAGDKPERDPAELKKRVEDFLEGYKLYGERHIPLGSSDIVIESTIKGMRFAAVRL